MKSALSRPQNCNSDWIRYQVVLVAGRIWYQVVRIPGRSWYQLRQHLVGFGTRLQAKLAGFGTTFGLKVVDSDTRLRKEWLMSVPGYSKTSQVIVSVLTLIEDNSLE
jgi:hypothetical protein